MTVAGINRTINYNNIYTKRKAANNVDKFDKGFNNTAYNANADYPVEKNKSIYEKAFENVGATAPESVKQAWIEAAEKIGTDGTGTLKNGMLSHISQLTVQMAIKRFKGEEDYTNILGNSVESAIQATQQALYNLDNPIAYTPKSIEVQQARIKERKFYVAFLDKLQSL